MQTTSYRVKFVGGSGESLAGIVDRPTDADPLVVAVFSHCFTCNKDLKAIVRTSRGLAARGIACLRYDMTGLGGSEGDFSHTNFTTNLGDLRSAMEFTTGEFGRVDALIGHSFGGAASLATAGMPTETKPRTVVALAAPSETVHLAKLLSHMDPAIESDGVGTVSIGGRAWTIRREMLDDFRSHDLPALISRIQCPTLLFHSPLDRTVGFDHAIRILGLIQSSPHAAEPTPISLISLDGSDHLLVNEPRDIDFVIESTAAFLIRYAQPA
ncbi:Alpha/beta hydrolase family protein [Rubripirellula tenax]|uniref:Alpha/beta hydrolase family protein n=1 Tax=Rubripirellula tenax TaxID=2528015 RepID=A0A5C6ED20_9BACT|nr:alpha/beta fold hydrolase [Rubripirellula tenax]TWU46364.1 Alpha/beta hydrolase family protein [Rubripirellula tenax]